MFGYDVDIHHWLPILTSAIASVNIGFLWWISRHIQYLNSKWLYNKLINRDIAYPIVHIALADRSSLWAHVIRCIFFTLHIALDVQLVFCWDVLKSHYPLPCCKVNKNSQRLSPLPDTTITLIKLTPIKLKQSSVAIQKAQSQWNNPS